MDKKQNISIYPQAIIELKMIMAALDANRPFLVTGKKSFNNSGAKNTLNWLFEDYNVCRYDDFQINPDSKDVEKGVELFRQFSGDLIISIGGGSVIDMAKLINYYHNSDIFKITEHKLTNEKTRFITHIAIPTTAGSGSESTHFAVLYIGNKKFSITDRNLIPDYVLIDPELLFSQSDYQKAVSGIDALSQAIESIWSNNATEFSRMYAEYALQLVWENLPKMILNSDYDAHIKVALGSNLAGRAINISKTTAPHALAYGFTKYAGLPHGHAVAISLPYFLNLHQNATDINCANKKGKDAILKALDRIDRIIKFRRNKDILKDFFQAINISIDIKKLNISEETCRKVIANVNIDRLENNPVSLDPDNLLSYLTKS